MNVIDTMNKIRVYLFLTLIICACSSHKSAVKDQKGGKKATEPPLTSGERRQFNEFFFDGMKEKLLGNPTKAIDDFKEALSVDVRNDAAWYQMGETQYNQKHYPDAEQSLVIAVDIDGTNRYYHELLAEVYEKEQKFEGANVQYSELTKLFPDESEYYMDQAAMFLYQNKPNDAIKMYDKAEKKFGMEDEVLMQEFSIYATMNKADKAEEIANRLIALHPDNTKYYHLLAAAYTQEKQKDKAMEVYLKILTIDPDDDSAQIELAQYYFNKGDHENAMRYTKMAFANSRVPIDRKIVVLYEGYLVKDKRTDDENKEANELLDILEKTNPDDAKTHAIYGDFLAQENRLPEAREEYKKSITLRSDIFATWQALLTVDIQAKDYKHLDEESDKAIEVFPNQPSLYWFSGIAKTEEKKYKEAVDVLKSGADINQENDKLQEQFYNDLGEATYRLKQYAESDKWYDKAIALDSNNALALNNYAYYLSVRNENLDKAEAMSKRSLDIDSGNASYQDTYGWILFQRGKYTDAAIWVRKALLKDKESPDVNEHFGDILYKLGDTTKAIEFWKRAKSFGSDSPDIDKKIQSGKIE